ncbi:MAG: hypothetical protein RI885_1893 [Actinomycetota bacterium]
MQNTNTLRAAIIGAGAPRPAEGSFEGFSIGWSHAAAYRELGIEVVAIADISPTNADALATETGARAYGDHATMLREERIDVLSVSTWPTLHVEMALDAASRGVSTILVEKPLAADLPSVDDLSGRLGETRVFVNHQRRFEQPFTGARRFIADGHLGAVLAVDAVTGHGWDLMSWGTHWVDMARFLADAPAPAWVFGAMDLRGAVRYGHLVEHEGILQFDLGAGRAATVSTGHRLQSIGITVLGERGTLRLADGTVTLLADEQTDHGLREEYWPADEGFARDGIASAIRESLEATAEGRPSGIDLDQGGIALEIILAGYASAQRGGLVAMPLADRSVSLVPALEISEPGTARD